MGKPEKSSACSREPSRLADERGNGLCGEGGAKPCCRHGDGRPSSEVGARAGDIRGDGRRPRRARDEEGNVLGPATVHDDDGHRRVRQVRERHHQRRGSRWGWGARDVDAVVSGAHELAEVPERVNLRGRTAHVRHQRLGPPIVPSVDSTGRERRVNHRRDGDRPRVTRRALCLPDMVSVVRGRSRTCIRSSAGISVVVRSDGSDVGIGIRIGDNGGAVAVAAPEVAPVVGLGREHLDGRVERGQLRTQHVDEAHHLRRAEDARLVTRREIRLVLCRDGVEVHAAVLLVERRKRREHRGPRVVVGRQQMPAVVDVVVVLSCWPAATRALPTPCTHCRHT